MIVAQRVFGGPLQALFHLLCAFRFEFGDRQGTVGKRLTSSFPWSLRRQAGELSEPSTIDTRGCTKSPPPSRYVGRAPRGEEGGSVGMSAARSAAKRGEKPLRVDPSTPLGHMSGATEGPHTPLLVSMSGAPEAPPTPS